MRARAPLDVDLEDKLLYGLTPMRLAYVVLALLGAFALWSSQWAPSPVRALACLAVVGAGAVGGWGRWRGRPIDAWIGDFALFVINNHRVAWNKRWVKDTKRRPMPPSSTPPPTGPMEIWVAGRRRRSGASTVAGELAACLASTGKDLWSVKEAPPGYEHSPNHTRMLVAVAAVDAGRVCYLDRGEGALVAGVIPEDESVRKAAALNQATVVAFPDAPASRAFRTLTEVIVAIDS